MIVGTAGHIDHGKTSLVRSLTGVDTDRLKEEKARGISIELGYAYRPMPNGEVLGFVDVPGHEKFVDHMVAGATGIDFVLLVIAADDGPMPQTIEHLDIVEVLGVTRGAIAMTKVDRVDAARSGVQRPLDHVDGRVHVSARQAERPRDVVARPRRDDAQWQGGARHDVRPEVDHAVAPADHQCLHPGLHRLCGELGGLVGTAPTEVADAEARLLQPRERDRR